jgi:hypothetical protein
MNPINEFYFECLPWHASLSQARLEGESCSTSPTDNLSYCQTGLFCMSASVVTIHDCQQNSCCTKICSSDDDCPAGECLPIYDTWTLQDNLDMYGEIGGCV